MKDDQALLWGGLALAGVVGAMMYQARQAAAKTAAAAPLSPYPSTPSAGYRAPVMSAPGYVPPVVGAAPPPAVIVGPNVAPTKPATITAPAPAVGRSAEQENAEFSRINEQARQWQRDTFSTGSADLLAKVQAGEIAPGSQAYKESFDYLANLTGGVATRDAEAAKLTSAGLPPPA